MTRQLTVKQERFVQEYCANGHNATQAAISAGYSEATARQQACRLLTNANIQKAIHEFFSAAALQAGITTHRVLSELAEVAFSDMRNYVRFEEDGTAYLDWSNLPEGATKVISEIVQEVEFPKGGDEDNPNPPIRKTRFKLHNKLAALEKLGQHLDLFKDSKVSVTVNNGHQDFMDWMAERGRDKPGTQTTH